VGVGKKNRVDWGLQKTGMPKMKTKKIRFKTEKISTCAQRRIEWCSKDRIKGKLEELIEGRGVTR